MESIRCSWKAKPAEPFQNQMFLNRYCPRLSDKSLILHMVSGWMLGQTGGWGGAGAG